MGTQTAPLSFPRSLAQLLWEAESPLNFLGADRGGWWGVAVVMVKGWKVQRVHIQYRKFFQHLI